MNEMLRGHHFYAESFPLVYEPHLLKKRMILSKSPPVASPSRLSAPVIHGISESLGLVIISLNADSREAIFTVSDALAPKGHPLSQNQLVGRDIRSLLFGDQWENLSDAQYFSDSLLMLANSDAIQWDLSVSHFPAQAHLFGLDYRLRYIPQFSTYNSLLAVDVILEKDCSVAERTKEKAGSVFFNPKHHASEKLVLDFRDDLKKLELEVEQREREAQIAMQWLSDEGSGKSRPHLESILRDAMGEVSRLRAEGLRRSREIVCIQELVAVGRPNMDDFLMDAYELTQELRWGLSEEFILDEMRMLLLSTLHTLKGNAGMYGFSELSVRIHDLEGRAKEATIQSHLKSLFGEIDEALKAYASLAYRMFRVDSEWVAGERSSHVNEVRVSETRLDSVLRQFQELSSEVFGEHHPRCSEIYSDLKKFKGFSSEEVRRRLDVLIKNVSARLQKVVQFEFQGGSVYFSDVRLRHLIAALGHVVRNAIDHGIETPAVREQNGKRPEGMIRLQIEEDSNTVTLTLSDDGIGIDLSTLISRTLEAGSLSRDEIERMSDSEKYQLIFLPGVSTKKDVSLFSGRGVGMYSAKLLIREQGGKIRVNSTAGVGTEFVITMPGEWR